MLKFFFGTPLSRAESAYNKHRKKARECRSKAREARTNNNYDYSDYLEATANNHDNMADHYSKVIERLIASEED